MDGEEGALDARVHLTFVAAGGAAVQQPQQTAVVNDVLRDVAGRPAARKGDTSRIYLLDWG